MPSDEVIYCPYTDQVLATVQTNEEHIVPLALGGSDEFVIQVCREFNSRIGSSIDGEMSKDFLVAMERTRYDARGHSGKEPFVHIKRAKIGDGRPAQVHLSVRQGLRVWDAIERRDLSCEETARASIECTSIVDVDLRSKFVAKVALSAGYAVYGNLFRDHVQHHELRGAMNYKHGESLDKYRDFTLQADDPFLTSAPEPGSQLAIVRGICNGIKGSIVMLIPSSTSLMIAVGILGKYVGMLDVAANTKMFPNTGDYAWGHVVVLIGGQMKRCSVAALVEKVASLGQEPKQAP